MYFVFSGKFCNPGWGGCEDDLSPTNFFPIELPCVNGQGHKAEIFDVFLRHNSDSNPDTYPGIGGEALTAYLKGLWTAFPDFSVEFLSAGEIEPGLIADHWRVRGTNTGTGGNGSEPTGRSISFQGASIIRVEGDKIVSDQTYFDSKGIEKQLAAESL